MSVLEIQVRAWRQQLLARTQDAATPAFAPMLAQLDQYWPKLFAPPLIVDTPQGPRTIQPQRTNNLRNEAYLKILLNGHATLEELFATIDPAQVRQEMRHATQHTEKYRPGSNVLSLIYQLRHLSRTSSKN
jgi:hypothetical protein